MGEGRGRRENMERTGGHGGRGNGYGRKKTQNATDLAFGDAPWGYRPV